MGITTNSILRIQKIKRWLDHCRLDWSLYCKNDLSTLATPVSQGLWDSRPMGAFRSQKSLKLRSPWIAQFYEVISWRFRLIKCSDAGKLTFFSLKWSWNDFKSKICLNWSQKVSTEKIWGQWCYWVGFYGGPKTLILSNFWAFSRFLDPP